MDEYLLIDRTLEDVSTMVQHAKLIQSDLMPLTQILCFKNRLMGEEFKLLEVSSDIANSIEEGDTLIVRGEEGDNSVICSQNKTYDIKEAETSNSVLLVDRLSFPDQIDCNDDRKLCRDSVLGVFHKYLELSEIRPKLWKLRKLLNKDPLCEESLKNNPTGYATEQLLDVVQASIKELKDGLKDLETVQYNGMWFILDQDYQMKILSFILRYFDENSWKLDCVQKAETVKELSDLVPAELVGQVFDIYCNQMTGGSNDEFSVDRDRVCRFYGDFLLAANTGYQLPEFLEMWQKAVPDGIKTEISQLSGLILIDDSRDPQIIKRFSERDLPIDIAERLNVLFNAREKWTLDEITPFVNSLTTNKLNVNALLTKYARALNVGGKKLFCAKHGK